MLIMQKDFDWVVYIIKCQDGTLYTGITIDLNRRINEHENGKGAKYTKGRNPLRLVYTESNHSKSTALKREAQIKSLSRSAKLQLIKTD